MDPLHVAYRRLQAVPQREWDALARKKIYFGHQSVGQNVIEGLQEVLKRSPMIRFDIRETSDPGEFESAIFAHSLIGTNRDPKGKIDHFRRLLESGIGQKADLAFFKFCYVDVTEGTDIEELIGHYDKTLAEMKTRYPNLAIIPVTVPLTNVTPGIKARIKRLLGRGPALKADNIQRNLINAHIRKRYGAAIWDLANAEATSPEGAKAGFRDRQGTFFLLQKAYTGDGGHLNALGSQVVAIDLLLRLVSSDSR